jgi:hypothetical protein
MGKRPTRKVGIYKPRTVSDPQVQKALDAIIERLEVLDGLRGDQLDQAVTYRDLENDGFILGKGAGGAPSIVNTPGTGISGGGTPVPEIGPAGPPTGLQVVETFLALLLTWTNTAFNLQHVEVWRNTVDNPSEAAGATMIGTTVSPQFVDYVGANASYFYWVLSVGTDGTKSAFNAIAGTAGVTGIDPGNLTIDPRFFTLEDGTGQELPFLTDGAGNIGIDGDLIVDGTIRAQSIVAGTIGADQLVGNSLSALYADLGTVTAGLFRTAPSPSFRVEIQDQASTFYPLWYGSGAKGAATGLFWCDQNGNVKVKGLLDTTILKGTLFTPANTSLGYDPFRIATQYSGQVVPADAYTGKEAHLLPMQSMNDSYDDPVNPIDTNYQIASGAAATSAYVSSRLRFFGPNYTGAEKYNRYGTYTEMFMVMFSGTVGGAVLGFEGAADSSVIIPRGNRARITLQYRYNNDAYKNLTYIDVASINPGEATGAWTQVFASRSTAWSTLDLRLRIESLEHDSPYNSGVLGNQAVLSASLTVFSPNFGVADTSRQNITTNTKLSSLPDYPVMA